MSKRKQLRPKKPKVSLGTPPQTAKASVTYLKIAIARIVQMESYMDEVAEYLKAYQNTVIDEPINHRKIADNNSTTPLQEIQGIADFRTKLQALTVYFDSGLWLEDYQLDESGLLPPTLKRGVLSQDGLYNLLQEAKSLENHQAGNH